MSNANSFCGSTFSGTGCTATSLTRDGHASQIQTVELDRDVGVVAPAAAGGYVAAAARAFLFVDEAGSVTELASLTDAPSGVRFNDGACDERGRFWVGTMAYDKSPGVGAVYRLELDASISTVLTGLTIPDGIGWTQMAPSCISTTAAPAACTSLTLTPAPASRGTDARWWRSNSRARRRTASRSTTEAISGWRCTAAGRCITIRPAGNSLAFWNFRLPRPPRVRSAKQTAARCSSPPAASSSTRGRLPASRTPGGCSGSRASVRTGRAATSTGERFSFE